MEDILKFLGFGEQKKSPLLPDSSREIKTDTGSPPTFLEVKAEQLDEWLKPYIPIHEKSQISPRRKFFKCLILGGCIAYSAACYKKEPANLTRKLRRRYYRLTGGCLIGFSALLICRWFDILVYKPVIVERKPGESKLWFICKGIKQKLSPEKGSMIDRYILGNEPDSEVLSKSKLDDTPSKTSASD